jgi:hypothetical protein
MTDSTQFEWRAVYDRSRRNRKQFKVALAIYALADYCFLLWATHTGQAWLAVLGEFLASQLPIFFVGWLWEKRNPITNLNPLTQSWAFLGDYFGLGPMAYCAARAFPLLPTGRWFDSGLWQVVWGIASLLIGLGLAALFRRGEGDVYDVLRYHAYTKLLHNGVAFTVLAAFVVHAMVPIMFAGPWTGSASPYTIAATVCLAAWLLSGLGDGFCRPRGSKIALSPANLHPQGDERGHRHSPEITGVPTWNEFRNRHPSAVDGWADILHTRKLFAHLVRK